MRTASIPVLLALVLVGTAAEVHAQAAPQPGTCAPSAAQADLDINDVFARVFNSGSLFFGNQTVAGQGYLVPKAAAHSAVFASGLWVGGKVGGQLRVAGSRYDNFNFFPGPLNPATGRPVNPADCRPFDRIFSVSRIDISAAESGNVSPDVRDWPYELGAPVVDGDGNANNYNFAAGDRPDIIGDQGLWWVMNDVGGPHTLQATPPLGIEVQVLAFAFSRSDALGSTTFYKYRIINKGPAPIVDTYVSIFADPDLGDFEDDFVGSDVAAGLGYVYNGAPEDLQYGIPPAIGYDFFQGPIVADGDDAGTDLDTLGTSSISYFQNTALAAPVSDPQTGVEIYNYMQGLWKDGTPMRARGDGYGPQGGAPVTQFMFPGDPVTNQAWSEVNTGGDPPINDPDDRRFAIHTGPFVLEVGVPQDIVFGIVFGQGTSNLNSITVMRAADLLAQSAYNANFALAPPPNAPPLCQEGNAVLAPGSGRCLEAVELDGQATLVWGYPETDPNYLGGFEIEDVLLRGQNAPDSTYNFEGFNVYRYPTSSFAADQRELIATYDVINGVTRVLENRLDPVTGATRPFVTAEGRDSGVRYSFDITGLTNFTDYYYGVSAYAYNEFSIPKANESRPTEVTVRPSPLVGGVAPQSGIDTTLTATPTVRLGVRGITARVVDPTAITGDRYEVRFFNPTNAAGAVVDSVLTYSIVNVTDNVTVLNGQTYYAANGTAYPFGNNVVVVDGFTFDVTTPLVGGFETFQVRANASGPLRTPVYAATSVLFNNAGFPTLPITAPPSESLSLLGGPGPGQQVGGAAFLINQGIQPTAGNVNYAAFLRNVTNNGANEAAIGGNDYEWRFTGTSLARRTTDGVGITVPFELWDLRTTRNVATDDVRLIPYFTPVGTPDLFNLGTTDHAISGNTNDPFTDLIGWYRPTNAAAGQAGYEAFAAGGTPNVTAVGAEIFRGMTLVGFNAGAVANPAAYVQQRPEDGTIFRLSRLKPSLAGDVYVIETRGRENTAPSDSSRSASLDLIAAVPNPYLGGSEYESNNVDRVMRFTNLPEDVTTIRIFTVSGSLVNTLVKEGSSRTLDWNLETSNNLPVASGMYLAHVQVEGGGERTLKLGIINRRTLIRAF